MNLEELRRQRANLDLQIAQAEKSEAERKREMLLLVSYLKVACAGCNGTGEASVGGADVESDPPNWATCQYCGGRGYLYGRKFEGRREHDMDHNEVGAP